MENTEKVKEPTSKLSSENNYLTNKKQEKSHGNPREIIPLIRRSFEASSWLKHYGMTKLQVSIE